MAGRISTDFSDALGKIRFTKAEDSGNDLFIFENGEFTVKNSFRKNPLQQNMKIKV